MSELNKVFGSLIGGKSHDVVGIEFNGGNLRLSIIKALPSRKEVVVLLDKDIQNQQKAETAQLIRQVIFNSKVKNPRTICVIPSSLIITKNVELPSQDPREIEDIVNLQASRHTPYGREGIVVDYINMGVNQKNYTKILLVIVNRDVARDNFEILKKAGIEPDKISFTSESVGVSLTKILKLEKEQVPVGIIHIDSVSTDFNVLLKGKIIFSRSIPIGVQNLESERQQQWSRFIEEIRKSLEVYKNEDVGVAPERLIVCGIPDAALELSPFLSEALKIPAEALNYQERFSFASDLQQILKSSKSSSFLGVIGAAFGYDDIAINLIPEEAKLKRTFEQRSREMMKTGALLLSIFILSCTWLLSTIYFKDIYLAKINKRFEQIHKEAEIIEKDLSRVKLINEYISLRGQSVEVLGEFYVVLPDEIKVIEIMFDREKVFAFKIKGTSSSMGAIWSLVESLNGSAYFKEAKTRYTSKRKEGKEDLNDFEIEARLSKESSEESD